MLSQIAIENQIADEMAALYRNAETIFECDNLLTEFGATIRMYTSSDDNTNDPEEFNYAVAMELHETNVKLHKETTTRLTLSHSPATIESSNTTTTQETIMNSTINIESMTLAQLAELQVAVAARMQELINAPTATQIEEVVVPEVVEAKPAKAASRVKKTKVSDAAPKAKPDMAKVEQVAKQVEKNDEQVRKAIAAKAESKPAASTSDVSTMKYAELRSFISAATKSSAKAKEIATKVAANRGQKSWATVGRDGYETIYNQIINLK